jgi:purine-nucleoside phosphorylase
MKHRVDKIVDFLKENVDVKEHSIGIILGSGYGDFLQFIDEKVEIPFKEIPDFKVLGNDAETNKFVFGKYKNKNLIVSFGRLHFNYGYFPEDIADYIFVLKELGCEKLVICASVGSLNRNLRVGDIVTATDHINLTSRNPLYHCEYNKYGNVFVDMQKPYDEMIIDTLVRTAKNEMGIKVKKGTLVEFNGPSVETYAESRFCHSIGADFSAFHICNEVIACKYCKLPVVLFALVTNYGAYFSDNKIKHEDIVYNRSLGLKYYLDLLRRFILNI